MQLKTIGSGEYLGDSPGRDLELQRSVSGIKRHGDQILSWRRQRRNWMYWWKQRRRGQCTLSEILESEITDSHGGSCPNWPESTSSITNVAWIGCLMLWLCVVSLSGRYMYELYSL